MQRFLNFAFDVIPTEQSDEGSQTAHFRNWSAKMVQAS